ncbi:hypothetical protein [Micromonospora noduli]|uniref:hypothetical protein n=1 Tax=Micromonospora noduli TaxID=709876 RepID=UPI0011BE6189|nr:hypothetical protein [Micromonospora noduli]
MENTKNRMQKQICSWSSPSVAISADGGLPLSSEPGGFKVRPGAGDVAAVQPPVDPTPRCPVAAGGRLFVDQSLPGEQANEVVEAIPTVRSGPQQAQLNKLLEGVLGVVQIASVQGRRAACVEIRPRQQGQAAKQTLGRPGGGPDRSRGESALIRQHDIGDAGGRIGVGVRRNWRHRWVPPLPLVTAAYG